MRWFDEMTPERSALVVLDVQADLTERFDSEGDLLARLKSALDQARSVGMRVVFVRVGLRGGCVDVSRRNQSFSALQEAGDLQETSEGNRIDDRLERREDEPIVTKRRTGAFGSTDLDVVLRSNDVESLVLCGIVTGGAVLSTLRVGADLDYRCAVLSDGCIDPDPEVHRVLIEKLFPRQAEVITVSEFVDALASHK